MITKITITQQGDAYVVTCTFDETTTSATPSQQTIIVPVEAIADRRAFYGCATDDEALGCILAEHYARLNGVDQRPPVDPATGKRKGWEEMSTDERRNATGAAKQAQIIASPLKLTPGVSSV